MVTKMKEMLQMIPTSKIWQNHKNVTGMKGLIGALLLSTSAHICNAPMASYIVRNESRFHFPHDFAYYVNLKDFETSNFQDLSVDSIDGTPFLTSSVANYLCRSVELEGICLYDFLACYYTVCRGSDKTFPWIKSHPSKNHLGVTASKYEKIPIVNFNDFIDTKSFGMRSIDIVNVLQIQEQDSGLRSMETYAKKANLLFYPFQAIADLQSEGSYLKCFQDALTTGILQEHHVRYLLGNIQDCHNSLNAGRPQDALQLTTELPTSNDVMAEIENDLEMVSPADIEDAFAELLDAVPHLTGPTIDLRNSENIFQCDSRVIRQCGMSKCGSENIARPTLPIETCSVGYNNESNHDTSHQTLHHINTNANAHELESVKFPTIKGLHELAISVTERIIDDDGKGDMKATGTLHNIQEYADFHFRQDSDQKCAFESITSAFILRMHDEAARHARDGEPIQPQKRQKLDHIQ